MQTDLFEINQRYDFESGDISESYAKSLTSSAVVSCDLETSGLDWKSQRIGLVQLYSEELGVFVFKPLQNKVPHRLVRLIENPKILKVFHHAMFDLRFIAYHWHAKARNIGCTKISSKILEPERSDHSLAALLKLHLDLTVDKTSQKSDWLSWDLSELQLAYAKADVASLPKLFFRLKTQLEKQGRADLAAACFAHLPTRVDLEVGGYGDVFAY